MNISVYLPFLASIVVGLAGPPVARRIRPLVAGWALATLAVVTAAGTLWATTLLAATLVDDLPGFGHYTSDMPVPDGVGVLAVGAVVASAVRVALVLRRRAVLSREVHSALAGLPAGAADGIIVLPDDRLDAFVVPRRRRSSTHHAGSRIVVTAGMLAVLDTRQQRALIAHERAHLRAGHNHLRAAVDVASAANPLLIPIRRTVGYLCERWADEAAVIDVGDRRLVADTIAVAALAQAEAARRPQAVGARRLPAATAISLGFGHLSTVDRVAALQRPAPLAVRLSAWAPAIAAAIVVADANATGELLELLHRLI
jgi:hypothetical protein